MDVNINEVTSLLGVLEYSNLQTSINELMDKSCQIMKSELGDKRGNGNWTWSVFSVKNTFIEQKAAGGINAGLRNVVPKREANTGMIARVIKSDDLFFVYESDVKDKTCDDKSFHRILENTQSAVVRVIERNNDIVGVINIESDACDDFDEEIVQEFLHYISNVIAPILSIDDFRNIISRIEGVFGKTLSLIEEHERNSLQVFFKDIVDLFYFEFRLEAAALFMKVGVSDYALITHEGLDKFASNCIVGEVFQTDDSLLQRCCESTSNSPISKQEIIISDIVGDSFCKSINGATMDYVRLYKLSVDIGKDYKYVMLAVSNNQFNPPAKIVVNRYDRLIQSALSSYLALERARLINQKEVLASELYNSAISQESHHNFLELAAQKIANVLNAETCELILVRHNKNYGKECTNENIKFETVTRVCSSYSKNVLDAEKTSEILNALVTQKDRGKEIQNSNINIALEELDESSMTSDIKIALYVINEKHLSDRSFDKLIGLDVEQFLSDAIKEIRQCMKLINNSIKNSDVKSGFQIIHRNARNIEQTNDFNGLVKVLHKMYGATYESGDDVTLSNAVQMLNGSYFAVFILDNDDIVSMTDLSHTLGQLPPNPPSFKRGSGLTGKVIDHEAKEIFVARIEDTNSADLECRSYWNKVLSTQFRYFFGKKIEFGNSVGVIALIGARTPYFQEKIFEDTVKSLFGVLADIIYVAGKRYKEKALVTNYASVTKAILADTGPKSRNVFLMVRFSDQDRYTNLREVIRKVLNKYSMNLLIADDKNYDSHLNVNLEAYMNSCGYCIALIDSEPLNSNIAYELGYMHRSSAKCLVLKDKGVKISDADFISKIWEEIELSKIATVAPKIEKWLNQLELKRRQ